MKITIQLWFSPAFVIDHKVHCWNPTSPLIGAYTTQMYKDDTKRRIAETGGPSQMLSRLEDVILEALRGQQNAQELEDEVGTRSLKFWCMECAMFDTCFKRLQQKTGEVGKKPWGNWGFMLGSKK